MFRPESSQDGHRVVAHGEDGNIVPIGEGFLQLDQLRPAPGSPISTPVKDHDGSTPGPAVMEVDMASVLI